MPATAPHLLTWEAFEQLPDDATHKELLEGELLILPPPKLLHTEIAMRILFQLKAFLENCRLGKVYMEAGYRLSSNPPSWVQPDVSFVSAERRLSADENAYLQGAPEIAIEVVSPSESAADIERKIDLMLNAGALSIWVVYPKSRHIWVYSPGASRLFTEGDTLTASEVLPGFEMPVIAMFQD